LANKTITKETPFQLEQQLIQELQQLQTDPAEAFKITKQNTTKPTPTDHARSQKDQHRLSKRSKNHQQDQNSPKSDR
jgi:hypothetical protein